MDFVVVGFGLGALIVLVGVAVRDLAPRLRRSAVAEPIGDRVLELYSIKRVPAARWADACQRAARTIMLGGGAVILAAVAGIVAGLDNGDGANLVLAAILLAAGGIVVRVGMLANELFPIDRRSRERAWEMVQRAKPAPVTAAEAPPAEPAATADEVKPEPAVAAAEAVVAADVASNGASSDAVPAEVETAPAEEQPASAAAEEGESTDKAGEATAEAENEAPVVEVEEPSVVEAGEVIEAAESSVDDAGGDAKDQESAAVEVEAKAGVDDEPIEEGASEAEIVKEDESGEAREPSEVAVSVRTVADA